MVFFSCPPRTKTPICPTVPVTSYPSTGCLALGTLPNLRASVSSSVTWRRMREPGSGLGPASAPISEPVPTCEEALQGTTWPAALPLPGSGGCPSVAAPAWSPEPAQEEDPVPGSRLSSRSCQLHSPAGLGRVCTSAGARWEDCLLPHADRKPPAGRCLSWQECSQTPGHLGHV